MLSSTARFLLLGGALATTVLGQHYEFAGLGHSHGSEWEWAGIFNLAAKEKYTWSLAIGADGHYPDQSMLVVVYPVEKADENSIKAVEEKVQHLWAHNDEHPWETGQDLEIPEGGLKLNMTVTEDVWVTLYSLTPAKTGLYAFFCQHFPSEFQMDGHFWLRDDHGKDVEVAFAPPEADEGPTHSIWYGLGGAFLTTLPAAFALGVMGMGFAQYGTSLFGIFIPFASGAIAGTAVFLVLPEGVELTRELGEENSVRAWAFSLLFGWLSCVALHHIVEYYVPDSGHGHDHAHGNTVEQNLSKQFEVEGPGGAVEAPPIRWEVAVPVMVGDFAHGIVDGIVVGFAARACDWTLFWTVVFATTGHELPQEMSDFVVLVLEAKMPWKLAWTLNFLAAQGALLGVFVGYYIDASDAFQGAVLAYCAGVFLFIAFSELAPQIIKGGDCKGSMITLCSWLVGAAVLTPFIGHAHCGGHEHGGGHGGHGGHGDTHAPHMALYFM